MPRDFTTQRTFVNFSPDVDMGLEAIEDVEEIYPTVKALVARGSTENTEIRGCVFSPETLVSLLETLDIYMSVE